MKTRAEYMGAARAESAKLYEYDERIVITPTTTLNAGSASRAIAVCMCLRAAHINAKMKAYDELKSELA